MKKTVALVENPNSGKTTLFNVLTGANQTVGNWPGVTVERKERKVKVALDITLQDLPGVYSLTPYTPEEIVRRQYLLDEHSEMVLDILDATNLERNLYLSLQLLELQQPLVIALNMMDALGKQKRTINLKKLAYLLDVPVIGISALKKSNLTKLITELKNTVQIPTVPIYDDRLENALAMIVEQLQDSNFKKNLRWYAIKLFEGDQKIW